MSDAATAPRHALLALRMSWQTECLCVNTEIRARQIRGGSVQHIRQCLDCGESVGNPVKQVGAVPVFDEDLRENRRMEQKRAAQAGREQDQEQWRTEYAAYLASAEWSAIRALVMSRDGGLCQGCLQAPAEVVHHLTYAHVGAEFAFELVSLCNACHERVHTSEETDV